MDNIKTFIEDAVKGGWDSHGGWISFEERINDWYFYDAPDKSKGTAMTSAEILLDPLAWQAVGKTKGWGRFKKHKIDEKVDILRCVDCGKKPHVGDGICTENREFAWDVQWHRFIDALAEGKSINDALGNL